MVTTVQKTHLHEMLEQSQDFDSRKHDHQLPIKSIEFTNVENLVSMSFTEKDDGLFAKVAGEFSTVIAPTEWAWRQMFSKLGYTTFGRGSTKTLPNDYLMNIPPDLLATVMNRHIELAEAKDSWFVRGYEDTARAVLSKQYADIGNTELLETLVNVTDENPTPDLKFVRSTITPDTLHCKMVWKETNRDDKGGGNYGVGVYVGNGETGNYKARVFPMIQRGSCTNSIIVQQDQGIELVHRGSPAAKRTLIKSKMIEIFPQAFAMLEKMIEAEERALPSLTDVLNGLSKEYGWDDKTKMSVAAGTENQETVAGIVNGVSYAAHQLHKDNSDNMVDMEILAGNLLVTPDSVFSRYARIGKDNQ